MDTTAPHLDVLIIGAGLSGIGAAVHLKKQCPDRSFTLLESRNTIGGTWDLFRYPGIRSDSDMYTMGYDFKPWKAAKSIADGPSILQYIHETVEEYQLNEHIQFNHRVDAADWDSRQSLWRVTITQTQTQEVVHYTCSVLYVLSLIHI